MSNFSDLRNEIDRGREGKNIWCPLGFPKMGQHIGITKRMYTAIGGASGTGKTGFADAAYVLKPYEWFLANKDETDIEIRWIYRSMERSSVYKKAKWLCHKLWYDYQILLDVPVILSWGNNKHKVSQELYDIILGLEAYFDQMLEYVEIIDGPVNPTGIYKHVQQYANVHGKVVDEPYITKDNITRIRKKYVPNNPNLITIIIEDHLGKLKGELIGERFAAANSKEILDKMSDYNSSEFRDFYGFSPVAIMQFNRGLEGSARGAQMVKHDVELGPLPSDFKGSSNIYEDCDVALALYNPFKVKDFNHMNYDIPKFVNDGGYNRFRSLTILKNSYGIDDACFGLNFLGECGALRELPRADEIKNYSQFANIETNNKSYNM